MKHLPFRRPAHRPCLPLAVLASLSLPAAAQVSVVEEVVEAAIESEEGPYRVVQVVRGLEHPWAVAWLPDGRMLVTERPGRMHLVADGAVTELSGLPQIHTAEQQDGGDESGQGGLLDVAVHPSYEDDGWIYFTYSSPGDDDSVIGDAEQGTATALARARLDTEGGALTEVETLYAQAPRRDPGRHYGSRIVFIEDGTLVFSIGERGLRFPSQDLTDPAGALIRLRDDGAVPEDNPFVGAAPGNLRPEIFSFGHRNNQAMAVHPQTGEIWTAEHGPRGGDLVHRITAGANYGWPQVTFGVEYSTGEAIGVGASAPGVTPPVYVWDDTVAPSGLAFYTADRLPGWQGSLFAGSLYAQRLHRLVLNGGEIEHDEILLEETVGRIRDVRQGPDGLLYVVTDEEDGGVYRLEPAQ